MSHGRPVFGRALDQAQQGVQLVGGSGGITGLAVPPPDGRWPGDMIEDFATAARGSGVIPWRLDFDIIEEDLFNLAAAQPASRRNLTITWRASSGRVRKRGRRAPRHGSGTAARVRSICTRIPPLAPK
jgi:hypothetical protein